MAPLDLIAQGYLPIPLEGKRPYHSDWINRSFGAGDFHITDNIGIRTGRVIAIDVDIDDVDVNNQIADSAFFCFGVLPTRRRPNSPRRMYLLRTEEPEFLKITRDLRHRDVSCRIEVLGHGQQFLAFGRHPSGAEFSWDDWVAVNALPVATREQVADWLDAAIESIEGLYYRRGQHRPAIQRETPYNEWRTLCDVAMPNKLAEALDALDADDYGTWISAGMALKTEGDEYFTIWDHWSKASSKYPGTAALERRWQGFGATRTDLLSLGRSAGVAVALDQFEAIPGWEEPAPPKPDAGLQATTETGAKKYRSLADWAARKPPRWLVKGLLPSNGLFAVVAAPNVGKTFCMLDLMVSVTEGRDWFGHKVKATPNPVAVLFAYEGSLVTRARGIHKKFGRDAGRRVIALPGNIKLGDSASIENCISMLQSIEAAEGGTINMVAFDTLNLALMGGNENSSEDMGAALAGLKRIQKAFSNASVGVVHHLGKDVTKGARGHSSLLGGIDTQIIITEDNASGIRHLALTKSRDSDRTGEFAAFVLQPVQVGVDEDGDPVTSCYIESKDATLVKQDTETRNREAVFMAIHEAGDEPATQIWIHEHCNMKKEKLLELLEALVAEGVLSRSKGARNAAIYKRLE